MTVRESSIVAILKELETVLLETPVPDERDSHALNPNYTQQLKAFRGMIDQPEILSDVVSRHLLEALEAHSLGRELKVLSVGCWGWSHGQHDPYQGVSKLLNCTHKLYWPRH